MIADNIPGEDVLLLRYALDPETNSPRTRAFVRQMAKAYGDFIPFDGLRHGVLAFAAAMLPESHFGEWLEIHIQKATQALIRRLAAPANINEADLFAAGMLMWVLWIKNRPDEALKHARGVMNMSQLLREKSDNYSLSDMLKVFGPLLYGDARFYLALRLELHFPSQVVQQRTTFKERIRYQAELILVGSSTVPWLSAGYQALIDALWDLQWLLLSYLSETLGSTNDNASSTLNCAMEYVLREYNDQDLQYALAELDLWPPADGSQHSAVEEEVIDYLCLKKLSIELLITTLLAPSTLQGLLSLESYSIAKKQFALAQSRPIPREGPAHDFYTWAFVIDLGLMGLAFCVHGDGKGIFPLQEYFLR